MKKKFKVSILISVFNCEEYILDTLQSISNQTFKNWELIIVNDNSKDQTLDKIVNFKKKFKKKKKKLINLKKNLGAYKATNIGLKFCSGKYISFIDADDLMHKNKIKDQIKILDQNLEVGLVHNWYIEIDEKNNELTKKKNFFNQYEFNNIFPIENIICNSSTMFRKKILDEIKFYNKNIIYAYDYNFFLQIFKKYRIFGIKKFYTKYRIHKMQRSQDRRLQRQICKENIYFLNWSFKNKLISSSNIFKYFKVLLKNYLKFLF